MFIHPNGQQDSRQFIDDGDCQPVLGEIDSLDVGAVGVARLDADRRKILVRCRRADGAPYPLHNCDRADAGIRTPWRRAGSLRELGAFRP